jgi:hypothetical protein
LGELAFVFYFFPASRAQKKTRHAVRHGAAKPDFFLGDNIF